MQYLERCPYCKKEVKNIFHFYNCNKAYIDKAILELKQGHAFEGSTRNYAVSALRLVQWIWEQEHFVMSGDEIRLKFNSLVKEEL
jgi:hypothetical protein